MYPYGDTRTDYRPIYDEADDRAARRTIRFLGVGLFSLVVGATLVLSLMALDDMPAPSRSAATPREVATVTTLPPPTEVGPPGGTEVAGYLASRKAALSAIADDRVAVVSLAKYSTQTQAKALLGTLPVEALLVAPPGVGPAVVRGDLAAWVKTQTEETRAERDEIKRLLPTVDDPAFKTFYTQEVDRLDKAIKNFAVDSTMVFGAVVRGPAAALKALGAKAEVRLVDVGENANADPKGIYRGLRPEEQAKTNEPPLRPL